MTARRYLGWFWSLVALCGTTLTASSVLPLAFDEITERAAAIALVETVHVRADWRTHAQGKHIVTVVTFKLERGLKGQLAQQFEIEFLGGRIGSVGMEVDGMPQFAAGDHDVLFLSKNLNSVAPIVGLYQGRFRVVGDRVKGTDQVLTHDGRPFAAATASPARARGSLFTAVRPLTYAQFESFVLSVSGAGGRR